MQVGAVPEEGAVDGRPCEHGEGDKEVAEALAYAAKAMVSDEGTGRWNATDIPKLLGAARQCGKHARYECDICDAASVCEEHVKEG